MLKSDGESKHYGAAAGPRLGRQRANGVTGLQRQYVENGAVPSAVRVKKEVMPLQQMNPQYLRGAPSAGATGWGP